MSISNHTIAAGPIGRLPDIEPARVLTAALALLLGLGPPGAT